LKDKRKEFEAMNTNRRRSLIVLVVVVLLLALPVTAFARKNAFKARLTTGAELHQVIDSNASGNATFVTRPNGLYVYVRVLGMSGPVSGAHIHGPATTSENGPVRVSLCGNPAPAMVATCSVDADGTLTIEGNITSSLLAQWGLSGAQLLDWMENELVYVNVHTALNPAGEARGQIVPR